MALINYINIPIKIVYLDSNINKEQPDIITLPESVD